MSLPEKTKLKKFIRKLESYRGRHTEFISVYIPPGTDLTKTIQHLEQEQGTANNIKDAKTRKAVITALEKMIRSLRTFKETPKNGLAIFSGNITDKDNVDDYQVFHIEPPQELNVKLYRCDQRFVLYPLEEMQGADVVYGVVTIDKSEGTVGLLEGNHIKVLKNLTSNVPGKFKTGGQSAQRFERMREQATIEFFKRVASIMTSEYTYLNNLRGIIVGGPGTTKNNFAEGNYLNEELKSKIIGIKDVTYTNRYGLQELVDKSQDLLANEEIMKEKQIVTEFLERLSKEPYRAAYGEEKVRIALEAGAVDKLILYSELDEKLIEELSDWAEESSSEVHVVSDRTSEGAQLKGLSGICAILRFPVE